MQIAVSKLSEQLEEEKQQKGFASLSADENIPDSEIKQYHDALSWALKEKHLKNIALTGPYGSGKSSILLSFIRKHPEYNFLNVSLASFAPAKGQQTGLGEPLNSPQTVDEADLEQNIVKQIFYSSSPSDIPDTTISRRQGLGRWGLRRASAIVAVWALSIVYLSKIEFKRQPSLVTGFVREHETTLDVVAYVAFLLGVCLVLHRAVRSFRKFALDKFKFSASSLEIEGQNTKSILNRNVDELIYFFSVKNYKGLIIEDIDRFRNTDIFSKLRALNILLNNSGKFKETPLVFIYAIQDDLFSVNDRTKFFDFIIPVIPVVNSSNAGEQLVKLLQNGTHANNLEASFVLSIGSYVRDMRMVKNLYNEYVMYKDKIGIDAEFKLLGMIAYKNIYPDDFSALHEGRGMIHDVFANKEQVVVKESAALAEEIEVLEQSIAAMQREIAQNTTELNAIYVLKIIENLGNVQQVYIGNDSFSMPELTQPDVFDRLRQEQSIQYSSPNTSRRSSQISFTSIEGQVDPVRTYADRRSLLKSKEILDLAAARRLLDRKNSIRQRQKSLSILELSKSIPLSKFSLPVSKEPLLVYLIETGAIDELYQLYISNFYEGALKKNDQLFLIGVKTKKARNHDYQLTNIGEIVNRLSIDDFTKAEVLNFDLTEHLYAQRPLYKLQVDALGDQLRSGSDDLWAFIEASVAKKRIKIFELIPDLWPEFWRELSIKYREFDERLFTYLSILLITNKPQNLINLDRDGVLSTFVTAFFAGIKFNLDSQDLTDTQRQTIITGMEQFVDMLALKVRNIDRNLSLRSPIYVNNRYEISTHNLDTLVSSHGEEPFTDLLHFGLLTRIERSGLDILIGYHQEHLGEIVDLLVNEKQSELESPVVALKTINSKALSIEQKIRFIEGIDFTITDVGAVDTEMLDDTQSADLLGALLESGKFDAHWNNVLDFYEALGLSEQLSHVVKDVPLKDSIKSPSVGSKQRLQTFAIEFAQSEFVDDKLYIRLLPLLPLLSDEVLEVTPGARILTLIEHRQLSFEQKYISFLERNEDLLNAFLRKHLDQLSEVQLTDEQLNSLSHCPLSNDEKIQFFNSLNELRIRNHSGLISTVAGYIESGIVSSPTPVFVESIFHSEIPEQRKAAIFKILSKTFAYSALISYLPNIGDAYDRLNSGIEEFSKDELDKDILEYLKGHGFVVGYSISENSIEITRNTATDEL